MIWVPEIELGQSFFYKCVSVAKLTILLPIPRVIDL